MNSAIHTRRWFRGRVCTLSCIHAVFLTSYHTGISGNDDDAAYVKPIFIQPQLMLLRGGRRQPLDRLAKNYSGPEVRMGEV